MLVELYMEKMYEASPWISIYVQEEKNNLQKWGHEMATKIYHKDAQTSSNQNRPCWPQKLKCHKAKGRNK